ncbi:Flp pilus assembly protein CpaB [Psychromonas sp. Urea-02u-13]|uniref:Flp pilus assembly protein CpaB n=1 Tax=Psychromonas sp. Urea-02u-13 TaxID=2058326 RepID=UPI000C32DCAE|nr:Flp pilus assembly protein CpaB [Psychromonas sp. Urea-02u-13]PKG40160.1 Flp pilus assembly protein CpaB [Psychromonas sp. Urea-02u-13]
MKKVIFVSGTLLVLLALLTMAGISFTQSKAAIIPEDPIVEVPQAELQVNRARALTINQNMQVGSFLKSSSLLWTELDEAHEKNFNALFLDGFIKPSQLQGSLLTRTLKHGDFITVDDLIRPEDNNYLSSMITPGMRAVTLEVSKNTVGIGLFRAGNRVDVVLTSLTEVDKKSQRQILASHASEIVLQDIRLLAINNQILGAQAPLIETQNERKLRQNIEFIDVTFETTPTQAARLVLAAQLGELALLLRSKQSDSMRKPKAIWAENISENHNPEKQVSHGVSIYQDENN